MSSLISSCARFVPATAGPAAAPIELRFRFFLTAFVPAAPSEFDCLSSLANEEAAGAAAPNPEAGAPKLNPLLELDVAVGMPGKLNKRSTVGGASGSLGSAALISVSSRRLAALAGSNAALSSLLLSPSLPLPNPSNALGISVDEAALALALESVRPGEPNREEDSARPGERGSDAEDCWREPKRLKFG